jgi:uncharacterized paraquat-inducible protein A
MGAITDEKKPKMCKRCKRNPATDLICTDCKVELLNNYDSKIDWCTAFEIERIQQSVAKYTDDDD